MTDEEFWDEFEEQYSSLTVDERQKLKDDLDRLDNALNDGLDEYPA